MSEIAVETMELSATDIETIKLFDGLRTLRSLMDGQYKVRTDETIEFGGKDYNAVDFAESMMVISLNRFKELVDVQDPIYADFISDIVGLPYMPKAVKLYDEFRASA
jgi:hypothetical protein